jgi:hypothetical protein
VYVRFGGGDTPDLLGQRSLPYSMFSDRMHQGVIGQWTASW